MRPVLSEKEQRDLVDRARRLPPEARGSDLAPLIELFRAPSLAVIQSSLANRGQGIDHAEEVFQATCLKFITRGVELYKCKSAPMTYFISIAQRAVIDHLRRLQRDVSRVSIDDMPGLDQARCATLMTGRRRAAARSSNGRENTADRSSIIRKVMGLAQSYIEDNPAALSRLREALVRAFARLEQPYRRAIELYCLEDAGDQKTCAKIVGVSECTFAQNISRGRLKLALHLQQELEDGDDPEKLRGDHETPNSR